MKLTRPLIVLAIALLLVLVCAQLRPLG